MATPGRASLDLVVDAEVALEPGRQSTGKKQSPEGADKRLVADGQKVKAETRRHGQTQAGVRINMSIHE